MSSDVPNTFLQVKISPKDCPDNQCIIMKIRGGMVEILISSDPELYMPYVVYHNKKEVLYVEMEKVVSGMFIVSLLYYKKFLKDIICIGFLPNPYDPCVANCIINGKQHTITWHMDNIISSHMDSKVNDNFHKLLTKTYAEDGVGEVKLQRSMKHPYLGMILDFTIPGKTVLDMKELGINMINDFPQDLGKLHAPWN